jgi:hypothetical protein
MSNPDAFESPNDLPQTRRDPNKLHDGPPDATDPTNPGTGAESLGGRTRGRDLVPPPLSMGGIGDEIEIVVEPARRGPGARKVGLMMAAALALIGGGVGLLLWQRTPPKPAGNGTQPMRSATAVPVRPPEPPKAPSKDGTGIAGVTASQSARMQFMDRRDPNRVAGELRYAKLDPLEHGQQLITEPRAWIYLRDGRTVHVQAAKGKLTTPASGDKPQEPESGTFEGAVIIRVYTPGLDGAIRTIDLDKDRPSLMFTADAFTFNTVLSELTTATKWQASAAAWEYAARGMRLVYDEVSQRIELFETDGDNTVTFYRGAESPMLEPGAKPATTASATPVPRGAEGPGSTPIAATPAAPSPAAPAGKPDEVIYRAVLSGPVDITGQGQRVEAPEGTAWVRLVDGALRPGGVAPG